MREYEVHVSPSAMGQISDAVRYVRDELCMPKAASDLLDDLESAIMGLSRMPSRYRRVEVEPLLSAGVRRMNARRYSVFYVINDDKSVVDVFAVLYGSPTEQRLRKAFLDVR
ncbi:MAG: type II toxin-antitoxin system RelE/ParE family toxin [Atopobiaceae bacterium]|nr:type II toxin-antitoxin system RelE/ParE family toxin [Atopobiaceae bacterium]